MHTDGSSRAGLAVSLDGREECLCVRRVEQRGLVCSRSTAGHGSLDGAEPRTGDFADPDALDGLCTDIDVAYYCFT
ncbi:hypothetical protein BRD16_05655 [Halobacteriales archaeon SW_6_65_46]|nr:MAG: hypothetical protein BRD16_05655 [Halobacteriales archaeon SW_6_65_46]